MRPPNAVNHLTLAMASEKNTNPAGEKLLAGKDRPDWVDGLKNVMWAREKDFRFAFEVNGKKYARCWMCLSTDEALKCEIDHVYAWSKILAKLKSDADDPVERQKYPDKGKDMFAAVTVNGVKTYVPTVWALVYYSNDPDNVMFIHGGGCNQSKNNKEPAEAATKNVYSTYGNIASAQYGYGNILTNASEDAEPVPAFGKLVKQNGQFWQALLQMNEEAERKYKDFMGSESKESAIFYATQPLSVTPTWASTTLHPHNKVNAKSNKPAPTSDVQHQRMELANQLANPNLRRRAMSLDLESADTSYLSGSMKQKLDQLPPRKLAASSSVNGVGPTVDGDGTSNSNKKQKMNPPNAPTSPSPKTHGGPPIDTLTPPSVSIVVPPPASPKLINPILMHTQAENAPPK
jgi:hypothetical protein